VPIGDSSGSFIGLNDVVLSGKQVLFAIVSRTQRVVAPAAFFPNTAYWSAYLLRSLTTPRSP
jgi:hypothetical protein